MIDFTFSEEQEMFRKAARDFAETKVAPHVEEMEKTGEVSDDVEALGQAEMMAVTIPEEYGGLDLGYSARMIALEEISNLLYSHLHSIFNKYTAYVRLCYMSCYLAYHLLRIFNISLVMSRLSSWYTRARLSKTNVKPFFLA